MAWQPPVVRNALLALLAANAAGRYTVEGYQAQSHGAEELAGQLRHVTVFYRSGQFDRARSGWSQGPFRHAATFAVELTLAAAAKMDLSILEDPAATPQARQSALAASLEAAANADALWDELAGIVWNVLIDPRNQDLGGLAVADRWIDRLQKDNPAPKGEFVLLSGTMDYTCTLTETPTGETGVAMQGLDISLEETADVIGGTMDSAKQGAKVGS